MPASKPAPTKVVAGFLFDTLRGQRFVSRFSLCHELALKPNELNSQRASDAGGQSKSPRQGEAAAWGTQCKMYLAHEVGDRRYAQRNRFSNSIPLLLSSASNSSANDISMMFLLISNVLPDSISLGFTHRKRPIPRLPRKALLCSSSSPIR